MCRCEVCEARVCRCEVRVCRCDVCEARVYRSAAVRHREAA